jgi:perosamine synthetase
MEKRIIPISLPETGNEEWQALKEPLLTGWLTAGPKVNEFEKAFAKRHQVKYAVAVTSATTAMHLALVALDVKKGDEIIVPAFTWVSTANVVLYLGASIVFCDINPKTFNIDPEKLQKKITPKTKAIMIVHLFGLCAPFDEIKTVAGDIPLIEDCACAAGSSYKGVPAGGLGLIGCFSFHPRKLITTGEGGMITTNNNELFKKLQILRNHGASISEEQRHQGEKPFILPDFNVLGYNYRMTDLQGAIGIIQLKKLNQFIEERSKWANYYMEKLGSISWISLPSFSNDYKHGWQSFVLLIDEKKAPCSRNEIMEYMQKAGISTRPGTHAVHMLGFYKEKYKIKPKDFPGAQEANDKSISIPIHNKMIKEDFEYIVYSLKNII